MPTPPYIRKLRERIGSDYLWLSGATAVVYREQDSKVLLVRRSDNGAWTRSRALWTRGRALH